ncbi:MAG TPA: TetR/AcrR family transcriptional regulator [Actinomycetes bacterium]|jgi:AcrR family transcriptional regulator|nr:TetR/AcrR family transcriptional regulator [Actinomycetes bacterium]
MERTAAPEPALERRYRGRLPGERRAERRRRLLDAGLELFGTVGYRGTSIERLCAQAGVTTRHFYQEFPGREALLAALCGEIIAEVTGAVVAALAGAQGGPRSRTRAAIAAYVHGMLDDPRRARVVHLEMTGVNPELDRTRQAALHGFASITQAEIERQADAGLIARRDYRLAALVAVGGTRELVMEWVAGDRRPPLEELIEELTRIFVAIAREDP